MLSLKNKPNSAVQQDLVKVVDFEKWLKAETKFDALYDVVRKTDLDMLDGFLGDSKVDLFLKREDQQVVRSFKIRGAYYHILKNVAECKKGIIAASAGNHAQGVALAASHLNLSATIVMPETTPHIKVSAVKKLGGDVVLFGDSFDQANQFAQELAKQQNLHFIPPFDDPDVIDGQGSIGAEIMQQVPELDMIFVPVGGGGLLAGLGKVVKQMNPSIQIIGVEAEDSACMQLALCAGSPQQLSIVDAFADGTAVKEAGRLTFEVAQRVCDQIITVSNDEICAATKDIFDHTRAIPEPSGALAVAGAKSWFEEKKKKCSGANTREKLSSILKRSPQKPVVSQENLASNNRKNTIKVCAVLSGANINFSQLKYIAERCDLGEKKEALLAVQIPEKTGAFLPFSQVLAANQVTEFNYRFCDPVTANIIVSLQHNNNTNQLEQVIHNLKSHGYPVVDMTHDDVAKSHIRYMAGGAPLIATEETLMKCKFPERAGALNDFLSRLGNQWAISLFHYRYQGNAYGEVLIGFRVTQPQKRLLNKYLKKTGYEFVDVSDSVGYKFLMTA